MFDKDQLCRLGKVVKKYAVKELKLEDVMLIMLNARINLRIAMLRSKGYSDEQIIEILEKEMAE